jgi:hypothetical protein
LHGLIQQLESFIDPRSHVVIKGHDYPIFNENWNMAFMQGGSPILMSQAAVQHGLSTFLGVCGDKHWPNDDVALTLIANRSFQSANAWGDVRFAGAITKSARTRFAREWSLHSRTAFRFFNTTCSLETGYLKPLKVMVGVHTKGGVLSWRSLIEQVSFNWFPKHLLLEFSRRDHYVMCANLSRATDLASDEYLKGVTPLLDFHDPYLNFTVMELYNWGFEHIPRLPWLPHRPYGIGVARQK